MKLHRLLAFAGLLLPFATAELEAAIMYNGTPILEDFDSLPTSTTTGFFSATIGAQATVSGTSGWEGTRLGGTGTTMNLSAATSATTTTGALYSYGPLGPTEKALGLLTSASHIPAAGVEIVNNSVDALASVTISFTQEVWRLSGAGETPLTNGVSNVMAASWSRTGLGPTSANYLSTGTGFTPVTLLDLISPAPSPVDAAPGPVDGNLAENQALRSATIIFDTPLGVGESFFLRFQDMNDPGADAAVAIDNFSFSAISVPEPSSIITMLLGTLLAGGRLRRRNSANS